MERLVTRIKNVLLPGITISRRLLILVIVLIFVLTFSVTTLLGLLEREGSDDRLSPTQSTLLREIVEYYSTSISSHEALASLLASRCQHIASSDTGSQDRAELFSRSLQKYLSVSAIHYFSDQKSDALTIKREEDSGINIIERQSLSKPLKTVHEQALEHTTIGTNTVFVSERSDSQTGELSIFFAHVTLDPTFLEKDGMVIVEIPIVKFFAHSNYPTELQIYVANDYGYFFVHPNKPSRYKQDLSLLDELHVDVDRGKVEEVTILLDKTSEEIWHFALVK